MHRTTAQNKDYKPCIYPAHKEKKVKCKTKQENDKQGKRLVKFQTVRPFYKRDTIQSKLSSYKI